MRDSIGVFFFKPNHPDNVFKISFATLQSLHIPPIAEVLPEVQCRNCLIALYKLSVVAQ